MSKGMQNARQNANANANKEQGTRNKEFRIEKIETVN
jgi:hypothetical protein